MNRIKYIFIMAITTMLYAEEPSPEVKELNEAKYNYNKVLREGEEVETQIIALKSKLAGYHKDYLNKKYIFESFASNNTFNESSREYFFKYKGEMDFAKTQRDKVYAQLKEELDKYNQLIEKGKTYKAIYEEKLAKAGPTQSKEKVVENSKYPKGTKYIVKLKVGDGPIYIKFYMEVDGMYKFIDTEGNTLTVEKGKVDDIERVE